MEIINNKKEKLIKMEEKDKFTQNYEQRKQYFLMPVREMNLRGTPQCDYRCL